MIPKQLPNKLREKFANILNKNPGFNSLSQIDSFINGTVEFLPETLNANITPNFKNCTVISVDVERTFSTYNMKLYVYMIEDII